MQLLKLSGRTLRFIGVYLIANLQAAMEYRAAFVVQVLSMAANDCLWLFFWWTYFKQFPLVHGWQNTDIVVIWAISACGFGIGMSVFGNAPKLAALIMNGGLDAYLGMPCNVLLHVCVSASDATAWGDFLFGLGVFLLVWGLWYPLGEQLWDYMAVTGAVYFTGAFAVLVSGLYWPRASRTGAYAAGR